MDWKQRVARSTEPPATGARDQFHACRFKLPRNGDAARHHPRHRGPLRVSLRGDDPSISRYRTRRNAANESRSHFHRRGRRCRNRRDQAPRELLIGRNHYYKNTVHRIISKPSTINTLAPSQSLMRPQWRMTSSRMIALGLMATACLLETRPRIAGQRKSGSMPTVPTRQLIGT